ncbi:MAG TPA: hypothetical protein VKR83_12360 [Ktedonobacteraceae bacterium]|nr:hypothetical protein [Ktedonobacteraceae bacterium]
MIRKKLLLGLFAALSVVMIAAMVFNVFSTTTTPIHAAGISGASTPRYYTFHHDFSNLAASKTTSLSLINWSSSFTSGKKTYRYTMIGTNPAKGSATSTIPVTIVPLVLTFSNGTSFDGTQKVSNTTGSPIFQNAPFVSGTTQYGDSIQRAEFWKYVSTTATNYHVLVGTPSVDTAVTINVPATDGITATDPDSGKTIGIININWFDPQLQSLLVSMHFTSNMLPIFLSDNVYLSQGTPSFSNCCIGGYHSAVSNSAGLQTYIWAVNADAGVQGGFGEDVSALSHELAEWLNDPLANNVVPNWISPIASQYGCNNLLEVGDPLVGVVFTVSGFSQHMQDEAFFSWFARQKPSIGYSGRYTYLGTFTGLSRHC